MTAANPDLHRPFAAGAAAPLLATGPVDEADIHEMIEAAADQSFRAVSTLMVTAWGRHGDR